MDINNLKDSLEKLSEEVKKEETRYNNALSRNASFYERKEMRMRIRALNDEIVQLTNQVKALSGQSST